MLHFALICSVAASLPKMVFSAYHLISPAVKFNVPNVFVKNKKDAR
jgi:hypothetical protein